MANFSNRPQRAVKARRSRSRLADDIIMFHVGCLLGLGLYVIFRSAVAGPAPGTVSAPQATRAPSQFIATGGQSRAPAASGPTSATASRRR